MATYKTFAEGILGETISANGTDILQIDISNYMVEGLQIVVNAMPKEMLWSMEASQDFVAGGSAEGVSVGSNKILQVIRETDSGSGTTPPFANGLDTNLDGTNDAKALVECREIPAALSGRAAVGSGWQEEASESDPVYYKINGKVFLIPSSTSTNSYVYWIKVPPATWETGGSTDAAYNKNYLAGTILKEIEPLVMLYVLKKCFAKKLSKAQFGATEIGSNLEAYISDEDLDMAQAQQILITSLTQMSAMYEREFQMAMQLLMEGTYKPELIEKMASQNTYAKLQGKGA
tara:strand:+ start:4942 stop:5811 length:870 start_codon:yes stop_codon:yes gene_type:complete